MKVKKTNPEIPILLISKFFKLTNLLKITPHPIIEK